MYVGDVDNAAPRFGQRLDTGLRQEIGRPEIGAQQFLPLRRRRVTYRRGIKCRSIIDEYVEPPGKGAGPGRERASKSAWTRKTEPARRSFSAAASASASAEEE